MKARNKKIIYKNMIIKMLEAASESQMVHIYYLIKGFLDK